MTDRTCGGCTFCCKVMSIDELKKPSSLWCPHADIGKGCKIYEDRPQSCRNFRCHWLDNEMLPDAMRPDKSKVIFFERKQERRLQVHLDPDRPDAWREPMPLAFINLVRRSGVDVILVCGTKKNLRVQYERDAAELATVK